MTIDLKKYEAWFVSGSQHLYGEDTLKEVFIHSEEIVTSFSESAQIPIKIIFKSVLTTSESIRNLCQEANSSDNCVGLITWMHTFSPAKMWISGLKVLNKPYLHLHTQFNRDIPWNEIDMDFMNLNQSAHGGREFGFIGARMGTKRKVVVGHWKDNAVIEKLNVWLRAACAWNDMQGAKIARFGDNMRNVAVTEGDKVDAEIQFGYSVNGYGVGDIAQIINQVDDTEVEKLVKEYNQEYSVSEELLTGGDRRQSLKDAARIEIGIRDFLKEGNFKGFTDTFEDLHGFEQLPGIAVQRLMSDGYGFGAEGDWKTAALVRAMKVMGSGLEGGSSFMEDYTYHFKPNGMLVLGSHMLEICESIAANKPSCEIHYLSIGGKSDPVRLVFDVAPGFAINASIIDMGNRFRVLLNELEVVDHGNLLPKLPVARAVWNPKPDLKIAAEAWITAGGSHHSCFSQALTSEYLEDFADMAGVEYLQIDDDTKLREFRNEIRWNEMYYGLKNFK